MCSNDLLALRGGRFVGSPRGGLRFPLDNGPLAGTPPYPLHAQTGLIRRFPTSKQTCVRPNTHHAAGVVTWF